MNLDNDFQVIGLGLIGFGYWGPNLARNFSQQENCQLVAICDKEDICLENAHRQYPQAHITKDFDKILSNPQIDAVLIATPVSSHYALTMAALRAGKDVLVEKPLASNIKEGTEMVEEASRLERILAVDHTFLYTSSVRKIKELLSNGVLGDLIYLDSVRVNLGLFQSDINVVFDLAPHDISIATYLSDQDPEFIQAVGMCYGTNNIESVAYSHFEYASGLISHSHLSWLSPVKIRKTLVAGTKKMIVYDDMEPSEKIKIFDKGIVAAEAQLDSRSKLDIENERVAKIGYRTGDMVAPKLAISEALEVEAKHFLDCICTRKEPVSNGEFGLRILRQIECCHLSIKQNGERIRLDDIL